MQRPGAWDSAAWQVAQQQGRARSQLGTHPAPSSPLPALPCAPPGLLLQRRHRRAGRRVCARLWLHRRLQHAGGGGGHGDPGVGHGVRGGQAGCSSGLAGSGGRCLERSSLTRRCSLVQQRWDALHFATVCMTPPILTFFGVNGSRRFLAGIIMKGAAAMPGSTNGQGSSTMPAANAAGAISRIISAWPVAYGRCFTRQASSSAASRFLVSASRVLVSAVAAAAGRRKRADSSGVGAWPARCHAMRGGGRAGLRWGGLQPPAWPRALYEPIPRQHLPSPPFLRSRSHSCHARPPRSWRRARFPLQGGVRGQGRGVASMARRAGRRAASASLAPRPHPACAPHLGRPFSPPASASPVTHLCAGSYCTSPCSSPETSPLCPAWCTALA